MLWRFLYNLPVYNSVDMYAVFLVSLTALLFSCYFGVVASQNRQCSTFISDGDSSCLESWHVWGISCYKITEKAFTWSDARDECIDLGGVLAVPSSDQENEFTAQLSNEIVWIDCNDREVEGRWKCKEGKVEVAYLNWNPQEPNNWEDEDCAAFYTQFWGNRQWNDLECSRLEKALCKTAGRPVLQV